MTLLRVFLESPFAGDVARNKIYLQRCIRDCLARGEAPFASHQMYTDALDDTDPTQRAEGIAAGAVWRRTTTKTVVYCDYGYSRGMQLGIAAAEALNHPIEYRYIGENEESEI